MNDREARNMLGLPVSGVLSDDHIKASFRSFVRANHSDTNKGAKADLGKAVEARDLLLNKPGPSVPKRKKPRQPPLPEISITLEQAFKGCKVEYELPIYGSVCNDCAGLGRTGNECSYCSNFRPSILRPASHCSYCDDTGYTDLCIRCGGTGMDSHKQVVIVTVDPMTSPGTIARYGGEGGISGFVRLSIDESDIGYIEDGTFYVTRPVSVFEFISGYRLDVFGRRIDIPPLQIEEMWCSDIVIKPSICPAKGEIDYIMEAMSRWNSKV